MVFLYFVIFIHILLLVVEVRDLVVNEHKLTFALISRRNVSRTGKQEH